MILPISGGAHRKLPLTLAAAAAIPSAYTGARPEGTAPTQAAREARLGGLQTCNSLVGLAGAP
ncbi:hypothetical protein D1O30_09945 [Methylocystis hirsuta]|uniref:Uncharacterized protein n=1 Tax=Methylocystis hirsuta TaxID=369798 RepID=A0A3M9XNR8_9HYPH|nr:hypothetical protein D1O30_09945 [Methylocystis hirsuta]